MKILFIHGDKRPPGEAGGAESLLRDQAEGLRRLGHETAWWFGVGDLEDAIAEFQPDICHVLTIHCYSMGMAPLLYLQQKKFPHLIHVQDYWPFCAGRMMMVNGDQSCSAVNGVCHNECGEWAHPSYLEIVNRSFVVAGNRYTAEIYKRNGLRCDAVVELGVDIELFAPDYDKRDELRIVTSCAWPKGAWKGMHILRSAMSGLPYSCKLITGLPRVRVAEELKRASIFVFPSCYEETFGLSLCEGMASGCACISTNVAGARAQIEHEVTGLLVEKRDVISMRNAIIRLLEDAELRESLGQEARLHVMEDHSLQAMAGRWQNAYEEILNGHT